MTTYSDSDSFYIVLPSNIKSSKDAKIGNYTTQLTSKLDLGKGWLVGLCEVQYTNSWFNLRNKSHVRIINATSGHGVTPWTGVPAGRYLTIHELIDAIESVSFPEIKDESEIPKLVPNIRSNVLSCKPGRTNGSSTILEFGEELAQLLGTHNGFRCCEQVDGSAHHIANGTYDMTGGIDGLYIWSDVVEFSMVGDGQGQLLRIVKAKDAAFGERVDIMYDKPYYRPVFRNEISSIEVDVKDGAGERLDFKFGRLEIVLHFIRQQPLQHRNNSDDSQS